MCVREGERTKQSSVYFWPLVQLLKSCKSKRPAIGWGGEGQRVLSQGPVRAHAKVYGAGLGVDEGPNFENVAHMPIVPNGRPVVK